MSEATQTYDRSSPYKDERDPECLACQDSERYDDHTCNGLDSVLALMIRGLLPNPVGAPVGPIVVDLAGGAVQGPDQVVQRDLDVLDPDVPGADTR